MSGRLLVMDDDPVIGRTIGLMVEKAGIQHRSATAPGEFFQLLESWNPTHIVLDLVMPEMDGVEILQQLADRGCKAGIIISSGVEGRIRDAAERAAAGHELNVVGALPKPFKADQLKSLVLGVKVPSSGNAVAAGKPLSHEVTESGLLVAIEQNQFELAYQPKIDCATRRAVGFEALVRWNHPVAGTIMPDRFIPLAESLGLVDRLTDIVLVDALRWMTEMQRRHRLPEFSIAINMSAKTLANDGFADRLSVMCEKARINPGCLTLELTETAAMEKPVLALDMMTRIRMKGFRLSLDDFGTGYSSMLQLARLPFSEIKVDKSFVMSASRSQESRTIIRSIVALGHNLGLKTVAEGVEDEDTLDFLAGIGCDVAQGFHIARPMDADSAMAWARMENPESRARTASGKV